MASASNTIPSPVNQKVTEDDIAAMALYMVEKRHVWSQYKNHFQSWEEFAQRKKVSYSCSGTLTIAHLPGL